MSTAKQLTIFGLLIVTVVSCGCTGIKRQYEYVIVESKLTTTDEPVAGLVHDVSIFTIEHKDVVIKAHCQVWDTTNHCGELRVGEGYNFKRDDRYLTLGEPNTSSNVVLAIEDERLR